MATIIMVRENEAPVSEEQIEGMKQAAESCFEINDVDRKVTYLSADRKKIVCVLEARDVESVRRSFESAQVPYDDIFPASFF
jgi:hypothetical protein